MAEQTGGFFWYELMTGDVAAAQDFYGPMLGWTFSDHPGGMDYKTFGTDEGDVGGMMALTEEMKDGGARPAWVGYIHVADVDAKLAEAVAAGGAELMPATDVPEVGRLAMLADPSGAPFYIMTPSGDDGESKAFAKHEPMEGHCSWNELSSADPMRAEAFYTGLFGWEHAESMEMGDIGEYRMYRADDYMLGGMMKKPEAMPVSLWSFYFRVPDIEKAAAYIADKGAQVIMGPIEIPGGEYSLEGIDPQGAMFSIIGKRSEG